MQQDNSGHEALAVTVAATVAAGSVVLAVLVALLVRAPDDSPAAACLEWTDQCVVCARTPQGIACSTPGIACVRGPIQCLRQ